MNQPALDRVRAAYVDLLKRAITNYHYLGGTSSFEDFRCASHYDLESSRWKIDPLAKPLTLLSKDQLDLIDKAIVSVEERRIAGDFLEAGIWRGGAVILMRGLIDAYGIEGRKVFAADSFAGIPKNVRALNDPVDEWSDRWVATLDEVRENIARFGFLDDKIAFVVGFFEQSLHQVAGEKFSVIRLDSDSYDSVETSLEHLYPLVAQGGIVIIDDWHLPGCRMAVLDYLARYGIREEVQLYGANAFWVKREAYGTPAPSPRP